MCNDDFISVQVRSSRGTRLLSYYITYQMWKFPHSFAWSVTWILSNFILFVSLNLRFEIHLPSLQHAKERHSGLKASLKVARVWRAPPVDLYRGKCCRPTMLVWTERKLSWLTWGNILHLFQEGARNFEKKTVSYPVSWRGFETDISRIRAVSITSSTNLLIYIQVRPFFWEIMNVCVILWILCVRLCYSLTFYIILQVFVLLSVCLCYSLNIYFTFWLFVLLSECSVILWVFMLFCSAFVVLWMFLLLFECSCYYPTNCIILWVFMLFSLFSECFCYSLIFFCCYSLDVLLLFECWLCLKSSAHQHNILFVDKSRAGSQSRRPMHSLTETRMGLVMTSDVLFVCHALTVLLIQGRVTEMWALSRSDMLTGIS